MNPSTNHLVADILTVPEEKRKDYVSIPQHLQEDARRELNGRPETYVPRNPDHSNLSAWCAKKRDRNRARSKAGKVSRRRNR